MLDLKPQLALLDKFTGLRIAVLGDLMADRFIYGSAQRLSPEAPVPVVRIKRRILQPGGAANVGNNILSLGGKLSMFGVLGDDEAGHEVGGILEGQGAGLDGLLYAASRQTTVKTRVVAQNQQVVRFDEETTDHLTADLQDALLEKLQRQCAEISALVLSDYAKGVLSPDFARRVIEACAGHGVMVVVDPKPVNIECYAGADVIKPNLGEALRFVGWETDARDDEMEEVCRMVRERTRAKNVIVTAGGRGMFVLAGETFTHLPGMPREVYDVAGAGDTTLAAITLGLAAGADLVTAARLGNMAGSIAVGRLGIAAVTREDLIYEFNRNSA